MLRYNKGRSNPCGPGHQFTDDQPNRLCLRFKQYVTHGRMTRDGRGMGGGGMEGGGGRGSAKSMYHSIQVERSLVTT